MFRTSQVQDDGYVPLGQRTIELWNTLQEESGADLIHMIGEVHLRDVKDAPDKLAVVEHMQERGFWEILSEQDLTERFPGFRLHDDMIATYEARAGFVRSEAGILAHVSIAERHGATIRTGEEVTGWSVDGTGVRVETTRGSYSADRLIITTGPWAAELLRDLNLPLQVERTVNGFFEPQRPDWWKVENGAPNFLLSVPEGIFYGIPSLGDIGLKIGLSGGTGKAPTTPRTIERNIKDSEIGFLRDVLDRYMAGASGPEQRRITCMGTYTADDGFIVDRHPEHEQVVFGCGFCGRGYKFAPVIGEILAGLASGQEHPLDTSFIGVRRFSPMAAD
jgi:sarcosine oxidase